MHAVQIRFPISARLQFNSNGGLVLDGLGSVGPRLFQSDARRHGGRLVVEVDAVGLEPHDQVGEEGHQHQSARHPYSETTAKIPISSRRALF